MLEVAKVAQPVCACRPQLAELHRVTTLLAAIQSLRYSQGGMGKRRPSHAVRAVRLLYSSMAGCIISLQSSKFSLSPLRLSWEKIAQYMA